MASISGFWNVSEGEKTTHNNGHIVTWINRHHDSSLLQERKDCKRSQNIFLLNQKTALLNGMNMNGEYVIMMARCISYLYCCNWHCYGTVNCCCYYKIILKYFQFFDDQHILFKILVDFFLSNFLILVLDFHNCGKFNKGLRPPIIFVY